jgi:hypothetical protein
MWDYWISTMEELVALFSWLMTWISITKTIDDDGCEHFVQDVSISERWLDRLWDVVGGLIEYILERDPVGESVRRPVIWVGFFEKGREGSRLVEGTDGLSVNLGWLDGLTTGDEYIGGVVGKLLDGAVVYASLVRDSDWDGTEGDIREGKDGLCVNLGWLYTSEEGEQWFRRVGSGIPDAFRIDGETDLWFMEADKELGLCDGSLVTIAWSACTNYIGIGIERSTDYMHYSYN